MQNIKKKCCLLTGLESINVFNPGSGFPKKKIKTTTIKIITLMKEHVENKSN